jgi:hypothetical protein
MVKETLRRRRAVTSSLNKKFTDQLRNRIVAKVGPPPPLLKQASGQIFKDDVNGCPTISDISFMVQIFTLAPVLEQRENTLFRIRKHKNLFLQSSRCAATHAQENNRAATAGTCAYFFFARQLLLFEIHPVFPASIPP